MDLTKIALMNAPCLLFFIASHVFFLSVYGIMCLFEEHAMKNCIFKFIIALQGDSTNIIFVCFISDL